MNALENVLLPYFINPTIRLTHEVRSYASHLLEQVGLQNKRLSLPNQMSQGERQRVAISRALIAKPSLILADEPTAGLDLERSHSVMSLIEQIVDESKVGLLLVTHEPQIIQRYHLKYSFKSNGVSE